MGFGGGIGVAVEAVGGSAARLDALVRQAAAGPGSASAAGPGTTAAHPNSGTVAGKVSRPSGNAGAAETAGVPGGGVRDWWADPMRVEADALLEVMAEAARCEAKAAALKARAAARFVELETVLAPPAVKAAGMLEVSIRAEVGCLLRISDGAAALFLSQARALCTDLPVTLGALQAGAISWRHAVIACDETTGLTTAGTTALETHFLTPQPTLPGPDAPDPAGPGVADPDAAGAGGLAGGVWGCVAGDLTPGRFRSRVRAWRERHHPESLEKRHVKGVADRRVECSADLDGMSWFSAYLPAHQAEAIWNRTTAIARALQGPTESRTLTQLRADIFATALLTNNTAPDHATAGGNGSGRDPDTHTHTHTDTENGAARGAADTAADAGADSAGPAEEGRAGNGDLARVPVPKAQVLVTVPVFALLGLTDEPAELDGYGPVPASIARQILADGAGSFYRVLVDPRDGAPLEIGRTSYRIPQAMRNWLRLRDTKCPFPGCTNHSLDNDADHLTAWQHGGTTGVSNLAQPCPKHHRLKHASTWTPTPATKTTPPGWTSPAGRHYNTEPHSWHPPQLPATTLNIDRVPEHPHGCMLPEHLPNPTDPEHSCPNTEYPPDDPPPDPTGRHYIDARDLHPAHPAWDTYPCPDTLPEDPLGDAWEAFLETIHTTGLLQT
ncbi:DUF222 domain-containing protein [Pseudarthrobacter sp. NPDC092424]|uniref:HNH endonuclease signature motif containing protein n=1 Tax=Pseudarthrobacter sp. NPDC092424 TaxID=3364415 RepID=UPI00382603B1